MIARTDLIDTHHRKGTEMPGHNKYPDEVKEDLIQKARALMDGPDQLSATRAAETVAPTGGPSAASIIAWLKPRPPSTKRKHPNLNGHAKSDSDRHDALTLIDNLIGEGLTLDEAMKVVVNLAGGPTMSKLKGWVQEAGLTPGKAVATVATQRAVAEPDERPVVAPVKDLDLPPESELIAAYEREKQELRATLQDALVALDAANQIIDQFCPHVATYMNFRQRVA